MKGSERDSFASSFGMIVAFAGSAVGPGNMWRFPYLVGDNGGTLAVSSRFIDIVFFIIKYVAPPVILAIIVFSQI